MTELTIDEEYAAKHPTSAQLFAASSAIPSGITHDARALTPFPLYMAQAEGARKWDVDGHEYVCYSGGHGALLLGHRHPEVVRAVSEQLSKGTHFGNSHELEIQWANLVHKLVPSAERVRFTNSGTEATLLALSLARAYSGREKVLKFAGHFHGWHDYVAKGVFPPYDVPISYGIPAAVLESTVVAPASDIEVVERTLAADPGIGTVIIEPSGASWGAVPLEPLFLEDLRELTRTRGVVLIFDEVMTGFRWAPGGVQEDRGVIPDLTALAKILAGGLPGGAVAGRADIMSRLQITGDARWDRFERNFHLGTFNANPLSAAAGVATLELISDGQAQAKADKMAARLRLEMNTAATLGESKACVYGASSVFHVFIGACPMREYCDRVLCLQDNEALFGMDKKVTEAFKKAMLLNGVDLLGTGGLVSAVHETEDIERTVQAFVATLVRMSSQGLI